MTYGKNEDDIEKTNDGKMSVCFVFTISSLAILVCDVCGFFLFIIYWECSSLFVVMYGVC